MTFIKPEILAALGKLELIARLLADNTAALAGLHPSTGKGTGIEFSQYRNYQPGDDLRRLDWKLYARSDRFFIRDAQMDTFTTVRVVLDASASMAHQDRGMAKIDYARMLAAAILYLAVRQGDQAGLYLLQDEQVLPFPPQQQAMHLQRLLYQLEQLRPSGRFPATGLEQATRWFASPGHEICIIISDLHEHQQEIRQFTEAIYSPRRESIVFHLLGENEYRFNYKGALVMEDLETGEQVRIQAEALRKHYLEQLQQQIAANSRELHANYQVVTMDEPLELLLTQFMNNRHLK